MSIEIYFWIRTVLKAMKKILLAVGSSLAGAAVAAAMVDRVLSKTALEQKRKSDKHLTLFLMMNQWVKVKQEGKNVADYLKELGYKQVAVYGMSYAGETLCDELKDSGVEIAYGIDRDAENIYAEMQVVKPDDELRAVDAVLVTSVFFFDEIEEKLREKLDCPILSLEDILYEL